MRRSRYVLLLLPSSAQVASGPSTRAGRRIPDRRTVHEGVARRGAVRASGAASVSRPATTNYANATGGRAGDNKRYGASRSSREHASDPCRTSFVSQREAYGRSVAAKRDDDARLARDVPAHALSPLSTTRSFYAGLDEHAVRSAPLTAAQRREMLRSAVEANALSSVELTDRTELHMDSGGMPASEFHAQDNCTTVSTASSFYHNVMARDTLDSRRAHNSWGVTRRMSVAASHASGAVVPGVAECVDDASASHAAVSMTRAVAADKSLLHEQHDEERLCADDARDASLLTCAPDASTRPSGEVLDSTRRSRRADDGDYTHTLDNELLDPLDESVGCPRSVYGMRKLFVDGFVGYHGVVSRAEEVQMAEELLTLLLDRRAAYVAEEMRYCVNLYERELGLPGRDTLAFALARAPTLQRVLHRFFVLGLIPSPPNVCQVSEMIGTFAGYPLHCKPSSVGAYVGVLTLVSPAVLYLQHLSCPWFPRVYTSPRSLLVMTQPCLGEYRMGYRRTHHPFHTFEYATRVSSDYRLEVTFATVETMHLRPLREAVQLTDAAAVLQAPQHTALPRGDDCASTTTTTTTPTPASVTSRVVDGAQSSSSLTDACGAGDDATAASHSSVDKWVLRMRTQLSGAPVDTARDDALPVVDGAALRRALEQQQLVGRRAVALGGGGAATTNDGAAAANTATASAAQRRLHALKARHALAQRLRAELAAVEYSGGGRSADEHSAARLLRGHSPRDKAGKL